MTKELLPTQWQNWSQSEKQKLLEYLLYNFELWRLPQQEIPPDDQWRYYLNLSGRGGSKLLCVDTPILTSTGFKTMGTIQPGDTVFDEQGNPTKVIHCSEVQTEQSYKFTFSDNSILHAHAGHQWVTLTHAERKKYLRSDRKDFNPNQPPIPINWANKAPITTQEIIDTFTHSSRKDLNHCIPLTQPLNYPEAELLIDPYTLGIWLGDGSTAQAEISCVDQEILDKIELSGTPLTLRKQPPEKCPRYGLGNKTKIRLRELNVLDNKHIPQTYLTSSYKQRLELLRGLMDSDGCFDKGNCRVSYTTTLPQLADDVFHLVCSLGMKPTIKTYQGKLYGIPKKMVYQISYPALDQVFSLTRKAEKLKLNGAQQSRNYHRMVKSITPGPVIPMRCIMVDSPNSMYLAGTSLIPTHNTKLSSEEIRRRALARPNTRINLIAPTHGDARDTNIEGESGILAVCAPGEIEKYLKNNGQIIFNNGSKVLTFSAQEPERLRGKQSHYAFLDEFASFEDNAEEILQQVQMSNRLGSDPKIYITTTPKPLQILEDLIKRPDTHLVISGTLNNPFLATPTVRELVERYADTHIGAQELFGQILKEARNALWTRAVIDDNRVKRSEVPQFVRTIIAIDPTRTNNKRSDEAGIIVISLGTDGHYYVRRDLSRKYSPKDWAKEGIRAFYEFNANLIVVERSDGDMAKTIIHALDPKVPVRLLSHQKKGKVTRAEPAAALYEQGKVHHVGVFQELEDQLTGKVQGDSNSDDRYDALVYGLRELSRTASGGQFVSARKKSPANRKIAQARSQLNKISARGRRR